MRSIRNGQSESMRILVIDDVQEIRELFTLLLRLEGAQVVAAGTGREAMEMVRQRPFDVVLSDLGLPDIPGDMLIPQILAASKGGTRVAVITGCGEPHLTWARQAGADAVFRKPVEWSTLVEYLRDARLRASA